MEVMIPLLNLTSIKEVNEIGDDLVNRGLQELFVLVCLKKSL